MGFEGLGLVEEILKAIPFDTPTDVQKKSIPLIVEGKDVIAGSATGSGKTLAFAAGIIQNAVKGHGVQALILVPTRELAQQVYEEFRNFARHKPLHVTVAYGGVSLNPQAEALRTADILVGTPGRVLDLIERNALKLHGLKTLVLDEADRMLDMGFIDDVKRIAGECPKERQTLLFSATISRDIDDLIHHFMRQPVRVESESYVDARKLKQVYYDIIDEKLKLSLLVHFLKGERGGLAMVFCNTQRTTDFVAKNLQKQRIDALAIHGGFSQAKRTATMEKFHGKKFSVLVCTDVAARGLDISGVSHVYNFDIPKESKAYIHRIGRTARAGKEGKAVSLLSHKDHEFFTAVLRDNDVQIERLDIPEFERIRVDAGRVQGEYQSQHYGQRRDGRNQGRFGGERRGSSDGRGRDDRSYGRAREGSQASAESGRRDERGQSSQGDGARHERRDYPPRDSQRRTFQRR